MNVYHLLAVFVGLFGVVLGFQGYLYPAIIFDALSVIFGAVGFIKKPKLGGVNVKKYLGVIALATLVLASALVLANVLYVLVPNVGFIPAGYSVTASPLSLDWGNVAINETATQNITLTNNGKDIASLNMTYGNASTSLLNYTLSWDAEGEPLPNGYYITANFTLTIYDAVENSTFSFDIWITDKG